MLKFKSLFAILAAGALAASVSGCSNSEPSELTFAAMPVDGKILPGDSYSLAVKILEEKLGIPVKFIEVSDQVAIAQTAMAGKTDLMVLDGLSYTLANKDKQKFDLLGVMARDPQKEPGSYSYGLTTKEHPEIKSLADLKGKTVCWTNPTAPGYLYSSEALKEIGLSTDQETTKDMKVVFTGGSQETGVALKNGDCDAAFIVDTYVDILLPAAGVIKKDEFTKIWTSDKVPAYAFAANSKLPKDLVDKIRDIVVNDINKTAMVKNGQCDSVEKCTFLSPNNWGYVATDNSYYDPIAVICKDLGFSRCE